MRRVRAKIFVAALRLVLVCCFCYHYTMMKDSSAYGLKLLKLWCSWWSPFLYYWWLPLSLFASVVSISTYISALCRSYLKQSFHHPSLVNFQATISERWDMCWMLLPGNSTRPRRRGCRGPSPRSMIAGPRSFPRWSMPRKKVATHGN
jgi:hypothetical protein